MRRPLIATAGIVTASLLAVPIFAGNLMSGGGSAAGPHAAAGNLPVLAVADRQLPAFTGCSDLLDWYIAKALPTVGPFGIGWGGVYLRDAAGFAAPQASRAGEQLGSSTGTNVQEASVDEPDFAKTDGTTIVRLKGRHLVVTDVSGDTPRELSSTPLPTGMYADRLLLVGDRVLVFGRDDGVAPGRAVAFWGSRSETVLLGYDVTDPAAPRLVDRTTYDGNLVEARQYDGTVRLVLRAGQPRIDFVHPTKRRTAAEATRINKQLVRASTIEDWLPGAVRDGRRAPLVDCADVHHPATDTGFGTLTVVTLQAADPAQSTAVALTTDSTVAYSSADHLYVATNDWPRPTVAEDTAALALPASTTTRVYAFDLGSDDVTYAGSGVVPGWIADRWSMDEHEGYLRVATHLDGARGGSNRITVLGLAQGGTLTEVGSVGDLGPHEQLQAVRWFDDLAVLVTFRQTDPLYTVDLTDPAHPRRLGELKIPGFSSYLHPIGGDQLLGLGTSATARGVTTGAQISTFDVSDLAKPVQLDRFGLGRGTYLPATDDPHAFVYLPGHRTMLTSTYDRQGRSHIIELRVGADGGLTELASYGSRYDVRMLPVDASRVALVGNVVRLVDLT